MMCAGSIYIMLRVYIMLCAFSVKRGTTCDMCKISRLVGQRIRHYRTERGLSQERLAELSGCHPTYIGQIERGEKNVTIESLWKIASGLCVPLSRLLERIGPDTPSERNIPLECYEIVASGTSSEQEALLSLLRAAESYKNS